MGLLAAPRVRGVVRGRRELHRWLLVHGLDRPSKQSGTIARFLTDTFCGIRPVGVPAFVCVQTHTVPDLTPGS